MNNSKLIVDEIEYEDVDDFINNGYCFFEREFFEDYYPEMNENQDKGRYIITTIMENQEKYNHEFIFLRRFDELLKLKPIIIPEKNMFNSEYEINEVIFEYIPFKFSDYRTKSTELIDFNGNKRKKTKIDKTVKIDGVNFLIEENDFNLKEYVDSTILINIEDIEEEVLDLIKKNNFKGIYYYVNTLKTGEQINSFYNYCPDQEFLNDNQIAIEPAHSIFFKRVFNIPPEYYIDTYMEFIPYSSRLITINYKDYEKCLYHKYEANKPHDLVLVPKNTFSEDVLENIQEQGNKCKLIYSFETEDEKIEETYEFYKFRKSFQYNGEFIILKTIDLPENNWFTTDLMDIKPGTEQWKCK